MTNQRPLLSIVSPVYNEGSVIGEFVRRLIAALEPLAQRYDAEIVLVDDGSRDNSLAVMKQLAIAEPRLRVLELRRNSGQTAALQAGLDAAAGDIVVTMDSDLQHFPEEIPQFIAKIEEGWDVVCGWRHERQEDALRRWPSRVANYMLRNISGLSIHDIGTTYRAYRREIIKDIRLLGENHRFIPIFAQKVGARITELPIKNIVRPEGKSNYGIGRTFNVFYDMMFLYFYVRHVDRPMRIFGWLASLFFALGALTAAILAAIWLIYGVSVVRDHSGWFMIGVALLIGALQILLTGLVMEMLARLYYPGGENVQYFLRTTWTQANLADGKDAGERPCPRSTKSI
jgi:glycosyltransferase involved in cell wall biosynthesis